MNRALLCAALAASAAATADAPDVEYYGAGSETEAALPFSDAVRAGDLLFVSGKIGNEPGSMKLAAGGIQAETRQALEHIKASVEKHGSSMDRVVKCTVFLADMAEWGKMNEVYVQYFPKNKPARSALGASGLALNARVEIECIAPVGK